MSVISAPKKEKKLVVQVDVFFNPLPDW